MNLNDLPMPLNTSANSTAQAPNPFKGIFPATTSAGTATNISVETLMTAYPQFTTVTEDGVNSGTTQYNALQATVVKRTSYGLSVIGSFALQKTSHNNVESLVNSAYLHNYINTQFFTNPATPNVTTTEFVNWRSISAYDQPKVLRLSVVYAPPIKIHGSGFAKSFARGALEGWQITNWVEDASGLPLLVSGASGFGRPMITCNPTGTGPIENRLNSYFNQSCFQQLATKFFPIISPTPPYSPDLRGPRLAELNTSVMKSFAFYENKIQVQFRIEAYNLTNHPSSMRRASGAGLRPALLAPALATLV